MNNKKKNNQNYKLFSLRNTVFTALFALLLLLGTSLSFDSIKAQIKSIYEDDNTSEIAGITPLMTAVTSNDIDGVKFFSKAGRSIINRKNIGGASALHLAARGSDSEIVKILLDSGANVDITDNEGWTPLMRASLLGQDQIVSMFIDRYADASLMNNIGESSIILATQSDCLNCLKTMFEKFDFFKKMDLKILKEQLSKAYIIATNHENKETQTELSNYLDQLSKLEKLYQDQSNKIKKEFKINSPKGAQDEAQGDLKYQLLIIEDDKEIKKGNQKEIVPVITSKEAEIFIEKDMSAKQFNFVPGAKSKNILSKISKEKVESKTTKPNLDESKKSYKFSGKQPKTKDLNKQTSTKTILKEDKKENNEKKKFILKKQPEARKIPTPVAKPKLESKKVKEVKESDQPKTFTFKRSKTEIKQDKKTTTAKIENSKKKNYSFKNPSKKQSLPNLEKENINKTLSKKEGEEPKTFKFKAVKKDVKKVEEKILKDVKEVEKVTKEETKKVYAFPGASKEAFKPLDIFRKKSADKTVEIDLSK